jgi:hypothetical protein
MTRILACMLVLALAVGPSLEAQTPNPKVDASKRAATSDGRNPSHPADTRQGTPPCGYRGSNCPQPEPARHHDDTGRNIALGVGLGALLGVTIAGVAHHSSAGVKLSDQGPQFPDMLHESTFHVTGFVRGGWPLVVDYEPSPGSYLVLTVATPEIPPFTTVLPTPQATRRLLILRLPSSFGDALRIANFGIESMVSPGDQTLRYLRIYGFGCGPRAVGSVAIDQLRFGPQIISSDKPDTQLSFHSHTRFDRVRSEFMQIALVGDCVEGQKVDDKSINRHVNAEDSVQDTWNAKKARPGQIQFRVRGWMTGDNGGDWVSAFSPELVRKQ